jgi:hypothetical protein
MADDEDDESDPKDAGAVVEAVAASRKKFRNVWESKAIQKSARWARTEPSSSRLWASTDVFAELSRRRDRWTRRGGGICSVGKVEGSGNVADDDAADDADVVVDVVADVVADVVGASASSMLLRAVVSSCMVMFCVCVRGLVPCICVKCMYPQRGGEGKGKRVSFLVL